MKTMDAINNRLNNKTDLFYLTLNGKTIDKRGEEVKQTTNERTIKISDLINDNFRCLFNGKITAPNRIFKGGRSSFKSSAISIKLVYDFLRDDKANTICFRRVANYISVSIYEQIKWAIMMLGVEDQFKFLKSPAQIIHKRTNTAFYFYGVDDPMKIKSAKIAEGYVKDLWFEETAEFLSKEDIDTVADTFIREQLPDGKQVNVYYSYNPPRSPYNWINEWLEEVKDDPDYFIHHSTYAQDKKGFLSKQLVRRIEAIKRNDKDYYRWMYLGEVVGLGDVVYNIDTINQVDELPSDDRLIMADISIDTGYAQSATTFLFIGYTLKGRSILLDTYYYSPKHQVNKKAPSDFSKDLWEFAQRLTREYKVDVDTWVIDSADAALRNQFFNDYGIALQPSRKGTKAEMIESVRALFALGNFYVLKTDNNKVFIEEHKKYQWDKKTLKHKNPKVIEENDHTCDALQYYVMANGQKLKLTA